MIPRWILTPGHDSTLNFDPGSEFHVELWPRVMIPRWIMTPGPNFTLNCDPRSGSHFNVKFWSRVTIQRGILTRGHNSTWNSDPSTYLLPVELRLNKVSKFNGAIKIQQLGRVIIQRKIHWIVTPGQYSMGGQNFILHRHRPAASIARVSCSSLFPQVTYFHFGYAIGGRPFDSEGGGGGLAFCWNKYSPWKCWK